MKDSHPSCYASERLSLELPLNTARQRQAIIGLDCNSDGPLERAGLVLQLNRLTLDHVDQAKSNSL